MFLVLDQRWYGRKEARILCPIQDSWRENPLTDPAEAYEVWSEYPYGVLLVCGHGVDVLQHALLTALLTSRLNIGSGDT